MWIKESVLLAGKALDDILDFASGYEVTQWWSCEAGVRIEPWFDGDSGRVEVDSRRVSATQGYVDMTGAAGAEELDGGQAEGVAAQEIESNFRS